MIHFSVLSSLKSQYVGCFPSVGIELEGFQNRVHILHIDDMSVHDVKYLQLVIIEGIDRKDFCTLSATEIIVQYPHT